MILTERFISGELAYYRALEKRSRLSVNDARSLKVHEKGYAGECEYDRIFDEAGHGSVFVFRDVYLRIDGQAAQYDCLIVSDDGITVNEIKNYSGLYRYENGKWYIGKSEVSEDALAQLSRAVGRLVRMRYEVNGAFDISGKVVFPNIEFRLDDRDEALRNKIIMRAGLRNYLMQFKNKHAGRAAEDIAETIKRYIIPNPYLDKCADFDAIRKGLYCSECGGFEMHNSKYHLLCEDCGCKETKETHIIRAISDYKALFPDEKLTKKKFLDFVDNKISPRTAVRMLNKYCDRTWNGAFTHYTFRYRDFDHACKTSNRLWRYKDHAAKKQEI